MNGVKLLGEAQALPIIKHTGDEVHLSCHSLSPTGQVEWKKDGGALPEGTSVHYGVLHIPRINKTADGVYQCITRSDEYQSISEVILQVDDFLPKFTGRDVITLPPLADSQIQLMDVVLNVNVTDDNGIIFSTSRTDPTDENRVLLAHTAKLDNGNVVYEYDIGNGPETVRTRNRIMPNEWNMITLKNDDNAASIQLNSGNVVEQRHGPINRETGVNQPFILGGRLGTNGTNRDGLKGSVSSVTASGELLNLGMGERTEKVKPFEVCHLNTCLNGDKCSAAHNSKGFTCECTEGFVGEQCQLRSSQCKDENCNAGICLESEDTWQCVCPVGTAGIRCEEQTGTIPTQDGPLGFQFDTSYVALPPPKQIDDFSVSMSITPQTTSDEHILLYLANNYDSSTNQYMSLSIINDSLVYAFVNGRQGKSDKKTVPLHAGKEYEIALTRRGPYEHLTVNGQLISPSAEVPPFVPGTDVFVGGIPPGMETPYLVPEQSFRGCIKRLRVNGQPVPLHDVKRYGSGDVSHECVAAVGQYEERRSEAGEAPTEPTTTMETSPDGGMEDVGKETFEPQEYTTYPDRETQQIIPTPTEPVEEVPVEPEVPEITKSPEEEIPEVSDVTEEPEAPETTETPIPVPELITEEPTEEVTTEEAPVATTEDDQLFTLPTDSVNNGREPDELDELLEEELASDEEVEEDYTEEPPTESWIEATTDASPTMEMTKDDGETEDHREQLPVLHVAPETTTPDPCEDGACDDNNDVCLSHTCGMNGVCVKFNRSHYECLCKLYYDGPKCDIFKPIEHAAKFNGDAFIELSADEFPHLTSEAEEVIEMKFKSNKPNGFLDVQLLKLLFWQGQALNENAVGEDYISIGLTNGHLHYSYELGGGPAHMVTPFRLDDGHEHRVRATRRGRRGILIVDDHPPLEAMSSGILAMLNVDGNLFVGGTPSILKSTGGLHEHNLNGCVADLALNGHLMDLMGTAIDGKNVRPCDEWLEPKRFLKTRRRIFRKFSSDGS